jgi:hypothetical protein
MKTVRFAPLGQMTATQGTIPEVLLANDIDSLWWSRAERHAIKKSIIKAFNRGDTSEELNTSEVTYSKGFIQSYQKILENDTISSVLEAEFIFEVAKESFDRGIEKYIVDEIVQVKGLRQKKLKELIFFIQASLRSKSLDYDRLSGLLQLASEKLTIGSRNVAYLYGKADAFAVKASHNCNFQKDSKGIIIEKGTVIANPAA